MNKIPALAFVTLGLAATPSHAQTQLGTITACYYSTKCPFAANAVDPPAKVRMAQAVRDSGEHLGNPDHQAATTSAPIDAPAFEIRNTGTAKITDATFTMFADKAENVPADTYHIGGIPAGKFVVIVPGNSNDKKTHPSSGIFYFRGLGDPLDTSDSAPDSNSVIFVFNGKIGTTSVTSGKIVVGHSAGKSGDGTVASLNFLGGPGNADGPCGDCFDPKVIATISPSP
jgi:hypothetical protein